MTENFKMTPTKELSDYKELLALKIKEQTERLNEEKNRLIEMTKNESKKEFPQIRYLESQQNRIQRESDKLYGLDSAMYCFKEVKSNHNKKIQEIKDNGILLREIEDVEKVLEAKKLRAKEKNLIIPTKKEKKDGG